MIRAATCLIAAVTVLTQVGCNPAGPSSAHLLSVRIVPATGSLRVEQVVQFGLSEEWSAGARPPTVAPRFFGDDADVATVSFSGVVTGRTPGRVSVTGCVGDVCDSRLLTVTP